MKPIYLTTDTHFNHYKLVEVFKERPADFELKIFKGLKALPSDCTLIHLGDLAMGDRDEGQHKWDTATGHIKNRIILLGNHDKTASWFYDRGWSFACNQFIVQQYGHTILFSHEPKPQADFPQTTRNIHGHTHGNTHRDIELTDFYDRAYHIQLALEHTAYKPILFNEKLLQRRNK